METRRASRARKQRNGRKRIAPPVTAAAHSSDDALASPPSLGVGRLHRPRHPAGRYVADASRGRYGHAVHEPDRRVRRWCRATGGRSCRRRCSRRSGPSTRWSARCRARRPTTSGAVHQPDRDIAGVSRQTMSLLPSPLKSPVPTIDQFVATLPTLATRHTCDAVHEPDRRVAAGVAPQQVGLAVAVEVADAGDRPHRRRHTADPAGR